MSEAPKQIVAAKYQQTTSRATPEAVARELRKLPAASGPLDSRKRALHDLAHALAYVQEQHKQKVVDTCQQEKATGLLLSLLGDIDADVAAAAAAPAAVAAAAATATAAARSARIALARVLCLAVSAVGVHQHPVMSREHRTVGRERARAHGRVEVLLLLLVSSRGGRRRVHALQKVRQRREYVARHCCCLRCLRRRLGSRTGRRGAVAARLVVC